MKLIGILLIYLTTFAVAAGPEKESKLNFAFYSSAWGENTHDGLRLVVRNQGSLDVVLEEVTFIKSPEDAEDDIVVSIELNVPAGRYADAELRYMELLSNNDCIRRTMESNWRLAEVSTYTLNPSVRNLIIENTDSFRIYQCVETIVTRWRETTEDSRDVVKAEESWILYHFETRQD